MSTDLIPFTNDEFALDLIADGDSFNVAAPSLARALGFREAYDMTRSVPDNEKGSASLRTPGGEQCINFVTESGFYRVIGQRQASRVKDDGMRARVERFQSWFYGEVLPSIRKTGGYQSAPALPTDRTELLALAVLEATTALEEKDEEIAALAPKAEYVDTFVADEDHLTFRTVASTLDIGEQELRDLLIDRGWIYRESTTRWSNRKNKLVTVNRYCEYAHKKPYFYRSLNHDAPRFRGEVMHTLKITAPGASAVARLVRRGEDGPALEVVS